MSRYDELYYTDIYTGFDDEVFARQWALGCAVAAGYDRIEVDSVLEYGAGLGQNLAVLAAKEKWAVDVNDVSRVACEKQGFQWRSSLDDVPDWRFDLILSRHSLEHVPNPLGALRRLATKAKPQGRLILVVPLEDIYKPANLDVFDAHQHLYSWTPETIKNLTLEAGWRPIELWIHNGALFRRMLPLLPGRRELFRRLRLLVSASLPRRSAEIVLSAQLPA